MSGEFGPEGFKEVGIDVIKSAEEAWQATQSKTPSLLDEYEHVKPIGEGSFSVVKHYRHRTTGTDYAVKELKPALLGKAGGGYTVKVSDFGLGKDLQSMSNYTRSEVSHYGHIYYVAPEQREKLKNASARSDIYSLGKLLNFVLTGRDPDVLHQCEFTSVIERATRYDPGERHGDVQEFERDYEEIKSLIFSEEAVSNPRTLAEYAAGMREVNWLEFHRLAAAGEYGEHVYADFVAPAVALLSEGDNLNKYYAAVGNSVGEFVTTFVGRLDTLAGLLGWPFDETKSFGALLRDLYSRVRDPRVKLQCLKAIWNLAYEQDQWAVQEVPLQRIL